MTKQSVIAGRIFELGMKVFASPNGVSDDDKSEEAQKFISEYLDWLISLNDDNSKFNTTYVYILKKKKKKKKL